MRSEKRIPSRLEMAGSAAFRAGKPYAMMAGLVILAYVLWSWVIPDGNSRGIQYAMLMGLGMCLLGILALRWMGEATTRRVLILVLAMGIILRVGYMLYTPLTQRSHDIGLWDWEGHYGYTYRIYATGTLPDTNAGQFYHPPLQHILQALVVRAASWLMPGVEGDALFSTAKLVPCFACCAMLVVAYRLAQEMGLSSRAQLLALTILSFMPTFIVMSSCINNDAMMILFYLLACLYTLRWYKRPTMKHILLLALSIGLSMMAKVSGGTVALVTAPAFLAVLVKGWKEGWWRRLIGQFAAFLGVCAPLGLWYPLRNWLRFGQSPGYVLTFSQESDLYCGDHSLWERLGPFSWGDMFRQVYCQPYGDYNLWRYTLQCAVFGEYTFYDMDLGLGRSLLGANVLLVALSLAAMAYVVWDRRRWAASVRWGLLLVWGTQLASFVLFNLQLPFGCTMDYRYMVPTCVVGALCIAMAADTLRWRLPGWGRILYGGAWAAVIWFAVSASLFYTVW